MKCSKRTVKAVPMERISKVKEGKEWGRRVAVYFDMQNLYYAAKSLYHAEVNYPALLHMLLAGRCLAEAIGYAAANGNAKEEEFFDSLRCENIRPKIIPLKTYGEGENVRKKGNCDINMALDAAFAPREKNVDVVVLVTGDGDFIPVVKRLKKEGAYVEVASFKGSASNGLIRSVGEENFVPLDEHQNILVRSYAAVPVC